jgi:hypothetical protein
MFGADHLSGFFLRLLELSSPFIKQIISFFTIFPQLYPVLDGVAGWSNQEVTIYLNACAFCITYMIPAKPIALP